MLQRSFCLEAVVGLKHFSNQFFTLGPGFAPTWCGRGRGQVLFFLLAAFGLQCMQNNLELKLKIFCGVNVSKTVC